MDNAPEVIIVPESMTSVTEPAIEKDEEYYWSDNVRFLVQGRLFRVSRHQFIIGSKNFSEKYRLGGEDDEGTTEIVHLDGVTAAEFRVFLRIVFPSHTTSTTTSFTKGEWLTILQLSVLWRFHDFRKLAIEHLDGGLTDIELIKVGRVSYVPRWVLSGYQSLVEREGIITVDEADDIGNRTVNTLWVVRYLMDRKALDGAIENELAWRFSGEISMLEAEEVQRRTVAELELEAKRAEEERRLEEERRVKAVAERAERERLADARALAEIAKAKKLQEDINITKLQVDQSDVEEAKVEAAVRAETPKPEMLAAVAEEVSGLAKEPEAEKGVLKLEAEFTAATAQEALKLEIQEQPEESRLEKKKKKKKARKAAMEAEEASTRIVESAKEAEPKPAEVPLVQPEQPPRPEYSCFGVRGRAGSPRPSFNPKPEAH